MKKIALLVIIQSLLFSTSLYAEEKNGQMTESLLLPCKSAISGISRIPATLQIEIIPNSYTKNDTYKKTEGGYLIKLETNDSDGQKFFRCYLDNKKQVIDLKERKYYDL